MGYRQIWLLVEGDDDERLINAMRPALMEYADYVQIWQFQQKTPKQICDMIRSLDSMKADWVLLKDMDQNPCIGRRKESLIREKKLEQRIELHRIIVVITMMEGWYWAGLKPESCEELGIDWLSDTSRVTKPEFNNGIPSRFDSRTDFLVEILKRYSIDTACQQNQSFRYFWNRMKTLKKEV
jgi:hypothetical protein